VVVNSSPPNSGQYSRIVEIEAFQCGGSSCPVTNVALASAGATVSPSSQFSGSFPAGSAIDGEHDGNQWGAGGGWNDATADSFPDSLQVNFNGPKTITEIDVYTLKDDFNSGSLVNEGTTFSLYGLTSFNVQYWNGSAFVDVPGGAVTGNNRVKRKFVFTAVTTDKIRIVVNDAPANAGRYSRIVEIEAYACLPDATSWQPHANALELFAMGWLSSRDYSPANWLDVDREPRRVLQGVGSRYVHP
jgi:hypothetical protein